MNKYGPQVYGGNVEDLAATLNIEFTNIFEGNLEERSGRKLDCAQLVTIARTTPAFSGDPPTLFRSIARVTWGAGFGAGLNQALVDISPGGTIFTVGATKYLKIEIAHVIQPATAFAPCTYSVSWVDSKSGARIPAYFTTHIGAIGAMARSARVIVPQYAFEGVLLGNPAPGAADSIGFYPDLAAGALLADVTQRQTTTAPVIGGAESFDVSSLAGGDYSVVWRLRL